MLAEAVPFSELSPASTESVPDSALPSFPKPEAEPASNLLKRALTLASSSIIPKGFAT